MSYFQYKIHDSEPIGKYWLKVNNDNFDEFHITVYDAFRRFSKAVLVNHSLTPTTLSFKSYYPVNNFSRSIKYNHIFFPLYKYQALWENCNKNTIEIDCTDDVEDILNQAYVT